MHVHAVPRLHSWPLSPLWYTGKIQFSPARVYWAPTICLRWCLALGMLKFQKKDLRSQFRGGGNLLNKGGKTGRVLGAVADVHTHTHTHTHTQMGTLTISIGTFPLSLLHTDAFMAFGLSTRLSHLPCLACLALWAWWWFILEKEPLPKLGCLPLLPLLPVTWPKVPSRRDFQRAHHQGRRIPKAKLAFTISGQSPLLWHLGALILKMWQLDCLQGCRGPQFLLLKKVGPLFRSWSTSQQQRQPPTGDGSA